MKIFILVVFFLIQSNIYSDQFQNISTGLEVVSIASNKVNLKWKSQVDQGEFAIYYSSKPINDFFSLRKSEVLISSNFSGSNTGVYYDYDYSFELNKTGTYYFAVILNNSGKLFDMMVRNVLLDDSVTNQITVIPGINTTIQPIYLKINENNNQTIKNSVTLPTYNSGYLVTSLSLESYEDVFQLRWSVYPKNLSQYIFTIYRSRYPIIQYGSPKGLPYYTKVTNQFSFEDRNINFETPYYYAVVADNSIQWDQGINVFTTPAVLLKKSPPLNIKAELDFVSRKGVLPVNINNDFLTEMEIENAVRQTLQNLELVSSNGADGLTVQSSLPISDDVSILLQKSPSEVKANKAILDINSLNTNNIFKRELVKFHERLSNTISQSMLKNTENFNTYKSKIDKELLDNYNSNITLINKENISLSNKIKNFFLLEKELLLSDSDSLSSFKNKLNNYYNTRDEIRIDQYKIKSKIRGLEARKTESEKKYLSDLINLNKEEQNKKREIIAKIQISNLNFLLQEYNNNLNIYKKKHIDNVSKNIALKVASQKDINNRSILSNQIEETKSNISNEQSMIVQLSEKINELNNLIVQAKADETKIINRDENFYLSQISNDQQNNIQKESESRLDNLKTYYYKPVTVENVPDITEIPKETWMHENKEIWLSKNELWKNRSKQIIGNEYSVLQSKWMTPSFPVAVQEGMKSFNQKKYKEAVYLLNFVSQDKRALMALGQSYFYLGAYRDAFTVFITAVNMGIPESRYWLDITAERILERKIKEN